MASLILASKTGRDTVMSGKIEQRLTLINSILSDMPSSKIGKAPIELKLIEQLILGHISTVKASTNMGRKRCSLLTRISLLFSVKILRWGRLSSAIESDSTQ